MRNCRVAASNVRFQNSRQHRWWNPSTWNGTCQFGGFIGKNKGTAEYLFGVVPEEYFEDNGGEVRSLPAMNCEEGGTETGIYKFTSTESSFTENELPGMDFNHTWTIDAVTKKPALRCLRSTAIFDYRNALNAACKNINDAIEQQGNDDASRALVAGAGTETNPYLISSAADLEAVINAITIGDAKGKTYSGVYFRQEADIEYETKDKYAYKQAYFSGNYDGAGYKLTIRGTSSWIDYIQGAVFRNCELAVLSRDIPRTACNVLLLNCDLRQLWEIALVGMNVNIVNCLYKNTDVLSSRFMSSSWNENIVGLEDADEPICINNASVDAKDFNVDRQLEIFNAMDGIPSELKRYMYGWTKNKGYATRLVLCKSEGATVNFDLAEDVEINKVWDLKYADNTKTELSSAQPLEEGRYIRNEKRIVGVRVPAGSCLVFEISYNGDAEDSKYVMMTDAANTEKRGQLGAEYNLKSLIYELWKAMRANREDGESNANMEMQIYRAGDSINAHYLPDVIEQIEVPAGKINTVRLDEETITLPGGSIFSLVGGSKDIEIPSTIQEVAIPLEKMKQVMQDETGVLLLPLESEIVGTEDVIVEGKNDQIIIRNKEFGDLGNSDFEELAQNAGNAAIGTLPADTTSVHYDVMEGEQTISLYKQGEQYRAVPILDRAYQGANIEKVRFYYTDRIYEEIEVDERKDGNKRKFKLKIEDFDNQSTELQNIKITRYFDIKTGADGQTEHISKTFENVKIRLGMSARWYSAESMKISTLPTKTYYLPGQEINLEGMEILLNEGKEDECVKPIEELFVVDEAGETSQYCHNAIGKPDGLHTIVLKTSSQYSKEDLGAQEVIFTIDGKDMSFNIEVVKMMPFKAIEVLRKPDQTAIIDGGNFSLAGASIQVTFLNNIKVVLDVNELADLEYTISEPDASGKATVTITSGGCTAAFEVDYIPKAVGAIRMHGYSNLNFFDDESFDFGSLKVWINYNNGYSELQTIDELIRRGGSITYDETSLGPDEISVERTATVSYAGKETTFKFTVTKANIVSAVEINKVPDRHQYKDGTLDLTGGSLKVIYRNGSYKIVEMNDSDYVTVSCDMSKLGEQTATASYTENGITKSAAFTINIENAVKEIDIITPTRTVYPVGVYSSLVLDGGSFVIKYKDDRGSETKPLSKAEISGFNGNAEGKQTIHVAYEGVTANFDVQVYDFNIVAVRPSAENFVAGAAISNLKNGASFDIKYSNGSLETINMNDLDGARITSTEYNAGNNTLQALGTKKFLLHYGNKTKEFSKLVSAQSIQVQNPPGKIVLGTDGKAIGTTNWGKLIVNGLNGVLGEVEITANMLEGVSVGNSKRITVRYSGLSAEFTTNVKKVRSIILPENLQREHLLGEPVRRNEAVDLLTVEYTDGSKASVPMTDNAVSINMAEDARDENGLLRRLGSKTVTVCYGGASAAYTIVVKAKEIQIVQTPKTKYISGEKLNIENGKIKVLGANDVVFGTFDLNRSTVLGVAVTFKKNGVSITPGSKLFVNNGESVTRTAIEVYCGDVCTSYAVTVYASEQSVGASEKAYTQSGNHQNKVFGLWYDPDEGENAVIVKNNGDNSSYTRRAYVQFDISACKEFAAANGLIIKSVKVKFDAKNRDGKARKTKLFTVNGTWPKNLTWKTATSSFTKYGQSKELQIKERKTYEVDIPVSQLSDKLTLCFEGERHNGGDMQYIYCNNNLECEITYAIEKMVESLTDMKGYKNVYMVGAALDKTQGSFKAKYTDGTEKTISFAQLSNDNFTYNFSTVGEKTVTVKYGGKEATYNVDVVQNGVSRITSLSKTEFKLGEPLDNEYINVTYNDGTTDKILIKGKVQVSGYDAYIPGTQTIEVSYGGKQYSETVTVNAEKLEWISKPTKVNNYYKGEVLNLAGGKIKAVGFDNGTNVYSREITLTDAAISDFITVKGNTDTIGANKITITYAGCSITFDVIVVKPWMTEINDILPKNFILGENRASTKARLIVKKVDGSLSAIALTNNENVTITDIATGNDWNVDTPLANSITSSIGEKRIKVVYAGKEKMFTVNINAKSISVKAPDKVSYFTGENLDLTGATVTINGVNGVQKTVNITSSMISGYDKNLRGKQTVVVTYAGKSATFDVTVDNLIIGLEIMPPNKTTYKKGEALNLAGGKVRAVYDSGEKGQYVDLTSSMVSGYDPNKFGKQTVTVTYAGKSATFDITVEKTVAVLEIIPPSKTTYKKGEALNLAGGKVREIYDNGEKGQYVDITSSMASGYDLNKFGKQAVIVMYAGKSATFDVTVEKTVAGLEIIPPSKTTYKKGEALNLAGGKVRTVYDSGEKGQYVDLTSSMVSGYDSNKFGKQTVTVTYAGKSATFDITVEKTVTGLEIIPPSKTTYKKGEALNLAGGKVRTVYDSGEKGQYVDLTSSMVSGYDPDAKIGQTITVTYEGMTATFDVQKERVIESVGMKTLPSKTTYEDETIVEDFDITGGTIEIRYSDGSREEKNLLSPDITITIGNSYTAADGTMKRTIKVSYKGFSTSFDVEVLTNNPYRAITNGEASLVQYNQARQTNPDKLMVKYTGDNNKYTRYAYVKFNLNDLKAELEQRGLEIKSAELCYRAQSSAAGYARDLYLKEAAEKTWTKWSNRPAMSATLASTRINSTTPKFIVQDITNYVKAKLAGGSVTFGFAASKCEGDSIYIPLGNEKPHLIIEVYEAPTISSIEVEAYPTLEYLKGQQLNLTGGSIKIIYSGGHIERKAFTDAEVSVSGYNPNLVGTQTITISHGGKNTQLNVNVYSVNNITVKNLPAAIQYKGEELNLAGGEITAKCSDGKSRVINMTEDGIIVKGYNKNKKGSQTLTLSYASKTVTFQINVVEKVKNVVEIRIVKKPKTSYKKGEAITFAGGQFQIIYSDGSKSKGITMNPKTPNGISKGTTKAMNRKGNQIVIVLYTDPKTGNVFSTRYTIKVS